MAWNWGCCARHGEFETIFWMSILTKLLHKKLQYGDGYSDLNFQTKCRSSDKTIAFSNGFKLDTVVSDNLAQLQRVLPNVSWKYTLKKCVLSSGKCDKKELFYAIVVIERTKLPPLFDKLFVYFVFIWRWNGNWVKLILKFSRTVEQVHGWKIFSLCFMYSASQSSDVESRKIAYCACHKSHMEALKNGDRPSNSEWTNQGLNFYTSFTKKYHIYE